MNWQDLGGKLIQAGAPVIGNALGGPLGGLIGTTLGNVLAGALKVDATPEEVDNAIKELPSDVLEQRLTVAEAEAQAKFPALAEIAKAEADAQARALVEINATMRTEAGSIDRVQRWWRPIYALELSIECVAVWTIAVVDILMGEGKVATFVLGAQSLLMTYWAARFGVLGVYVGGRSWEKIVAEKATPVVDKLAPSVIEQIVKAVRKR